MAGPEIAVASTKAYTTQVVVMNLLGMYFADLKGILDKDVEKELKESLLSLPEKIEAVLEMKSQVAEVSKILAEETDLFYLGRGADYALVIEGALKVKEISYVHSEAYAGGELKHGPIALIEKGTSVITLLTQERLKDKMLSNVKEVTTRGGNILAIVNDGDKSAKSITDDVIFIPKTIDLLTPLLSVIPLQLLAYYIAKLKDCDVDKPRNLAKSVTVE